MHGAYGYSDIHLSDEPASLGGELAIFLVFPKAGLENRSQGTTFESRENTLGFDVDG